MVQGARRPLRANRSSRQIHQHELQQDVPETLKPTLRSTDDALAREILAVLAVKSKESSKPAASLNSVQYITSQLRPITGHAELDFELYAFIALILKLCIQSWYNVITPDKEVNKEILDIIIACLQALQQRLNAVELDMLILDEIPQLVIDHLDALEYASKAASASENKQLETRRIFHAIRTHPALDPAPITPATAASQLENEAAWSQMVVDRILPLIVPANDMRNPGLSVMIREIFSEMILLRGVCEKLCEPWFLWESIHRALLVASPRSQNKPHVSVPMLNRISTWLRQLWSILQSLWLLLTMFLGLSTAPSGIVVADQILAFKHSTKPGISTSKRPILTAKIWSCVARLTGIAERMPWLVGVMALTQWLLLHGPGRVGGKDSTLDRWTQVQINQTLSDPSSLPTILRIARQSLFPDGAFAPARQIPTPNEVECIKRDCARAVVDCVPQWARRSYFATNEEELMLNDVKAFLDVLGDAYINKALIIAITELLVMRLCPELV